MDALVKLLELAKGLTYDQMIKTAILIGFLFWFSTEGLETWFDKSDRVQQELQRDLLVESINQTEQREQRQDDTAQTLHETQMLLQQRLELELTALKDDVDDLEAAARQ